MSRPKKIPVDRYIWIGSTDFTGDFPKSYDDDSNMGYFLHSN